jgi:aminopeptidase N
MAVYTVRVEADKATCPVLLSNGNLVSSGPVEGDGDRHFAVWHDPWPKPCYLFALVAGDLALREDSFTTVSGKKVALRIYTAARDVEKSGWAMESLQRAMAWDEAKFGREYDLDLFNIVAVADFNMGAMENKSLNIFNSRVVLASTTTASDLDYNRIEGVSCEGRRQLTAEAGSSVQGAAASAV